MKPNIYRLYGGWGCGTSEWVVGWGTTPRAAYLNWRLSNGVHS